MPDSSKGNRFAALVVAAHGSRGMVQTTDGERVPYLVRGRRLRVVCGDRVRCAPGAAGEPAVVEAVEPRDNELQREAARGAETLAANLSHLILVMAHVPAPDLYLVDRYLCAARLMDAEAAIAWNKSDRAESPAELNLYRTLGYPVWALTATAGAGLDALRAWLGAGTGVLVGQSGVGKSSLMNALVPAAAVATGAISDARDEGRHTTTASVLHDLPGGGRLVDTPGVRDFVPALPAARELARGFVEIVTTGRNCRYADCSHLRETECAVQVAVSAGRIDGRRFESYRRLMNLKRQADGNRNRA